MPEVDTKLAQFLRQAKSKPHYFALVAKGSADGVLIVDRKAVGGKQIAAAKLESGGTIVYKGKVFGEEGATVFELKNAPPGSLPRQLKTIIARDAGLKLTVVARQATNPDENEDDDDEAQDQPNGPDQQGSNQQGQQVSNQQDSNQQNQQVSSEQDESQEDQGEEEEEIPVAPPMTPTQAGPGEKEFKDRLAEVLPQYQNAVKRAPDQKAALDKVVTLVSVAGKTKMYAQGLKHLETLETLSGAILNPPIGRDAPPTAKSEEAESEPSDSEQPNVDDKTVLARMKEVMVVYREAAAKNSARKPELDQLASQVAQLVKQTRNADAMELLDTLESQSKGALRIAEAKEEIGDTGAGSLVKLQQARLDYLEAKNQAQARISVMQAKILSDPQVQNDDRFAEISAAVGKLDDVLSGLDNKLVEALDKALKLPANLRLTGQAKALQILSDYQKEVDGNPLLRDLDDSSGFGKFQIYKPLSKALADIARLLTA